MRLFSSRNLSSWALAVAVFGAVAIGTERLVRSDEMSRYVANRPSEILSASGYIAKMQAFSRVDQPKIALIGDSVALGQVMKNHGVDNWRENELSSALGSAIGDLGEAFFVGTFAGNGLRPADMGRTMEHCIRAGADIVIVIANLRGFSQDFETVGERYTADWREFIDPWDLSPVFTNASPRYGQDLGTSLSGSWHSRAFANFMFEDKLESSLSEILDKIRAQADADSGDAAMKGIQMLKMRRRLQSVKLDRVERFQTKSFAEALDKLDDARIPAYVVYATENPAVRRQLMSTSARAMAVSDLRTLVETHGNHHRFLGPDETMTSDLFFDQAHPTPAGYLVMARRIATAIFEPNQ